MAAITDYASLSTALNDWADRSETQSTIDGAITLAEASMNLVPGFRSYRNETTSGTLTTDANGEVSLPSGFKTMRSIVRDYSGATPLVSVSWHELIAMNPTSQAGTPRYYAVSGSTLKVADIYQGDFLATYETALSGLTSSNTTNWLITMAPHAYLFMCMAFLESRLGTPEAFQRSAIFKVQGMQALDEIGIQSDMAQYGNTGTVFEQVMP